MAIELKKEFLERIKAELPENEYNDYLNSLEQDEQHGLVVNLHKLAKSTIDLNYIIDKFDAKLIFKNNNFAYIVYNKIKLASSGVYPGKDPLYHVGLYYIQEPCASKVLYDVNIEKDDQVLDLCASPGGKTAEILFSLDKKAGGFLISNEIDYSRAKVLSSNVERLGIDNVAVVCSNSENLVNRFGEYFDKVIVDAPCSGEGMFRKSEEARMQWSIKLVESMSKIQKKLVEDAYKMLKVGGMIIYSTCTFSKEEDEEVVSYLLDKYSDLNLLKMEKNYPHNSIGEGQFFAILKKGNKDDIYIKNHFNINSLKGLNILRNGTEEFIYEGKMKVPTHASTHVEEIVFENTIDLNDEEVVNYLRGETLKKDLDFKGYCRITYKNLGLGLAKYSNGILKNHYPKGLRNN